MNQFYGALYMLSLEAFKGSVSTCIEYDNFDQKPLKSNSQFFSDILLLEHRTFFIIIITISIMLTNYTKYGKYIN